LALHVSRLQRPPVSLAPPLTAPPPLAVPWRRLLRQAWQRALGEGLGEGLRLLWAAWRVLGRQERYGPLFAIPHFRQAVVRDPLGDALFFLSHRHFLCLGLDPGMRLACASEHFDFEARRLEMDLLLELHGGDGLALWADTVEGRRYEIRWLSSAEHRHEGPLSLVLELDGRRLHQLSFAWVDGRHLQGPAGRQLLISRQQSVGAKDAGLQQFRADYPQHSPSYVVFAALMGVAAALGHERVLGIRGERQIAWEAVYATSFTHAYDGLWLALGGAPAGPLVFELPVPARMTDLAEVRAKHRARARARRALWGAITEASRQAVAPHCRRGHDAA
jgi:uncharacterized protein VirK/YbjX